MLPGCAPLGGAASAVAAGPFGVGLVWQVLYARSAMSAQPTHAQLARALVSRARSGTLCSHATDPAGYPYGSLVAFAADERGRPVLCISKLAEHTTNLRARPEASLLVAELHAAAADAPSAHDPLAHGRVTLLGPCLPIPSDEVASARATFLAQHPDAVRYIDFTDFSLYRLEPIALRYVGGFGRMSWIAAADYSVRG